MGFTRRKFIQTGLGAGAGLVAAAPSILAAASKAEGDSALRVAFIGCGKQQEVLFHAMRNIPGIRYVAVCDIMESRRGTAARRIRAHQGTLPPSYIDAGEMLATETDLDAVFVCTPDFWHAPHTIMALEAGCHVYCEKMMADTIEGARSIVHAAEKSGLLCQIGHQRRSNPRYLFVLNQLLRRRNIFGHIVNINGQWNRSLSASQDIVVNPFILPEADILRRYGFGAGAEGPLNKEALQHRFLNWRFYKALSGGPISDLGAHQIDIYNWFMGRAPVSVMASGGRNHFHDREHYDNVMCVFDYDTPEGGTRAFYQVLTTTSAGGGYFEAFMGTEGTVQISERDAYTKLWREGGSDLLWEEHVQAGLLKEIEPLLPPVGEADYSLPVYASAAPESFELPIELSKPPHQPHIENFFAAIRGEADLTCDARTAFASEAPIFWVNPAVEARETLYLTPERLKV